MAEPPSRIATHVAGDGYSWHYRHYASLGSPSQRGTVVCLHGIQSHGGWYEFSCERMAQAGFDVYFLDRRGAGLNQTARGDTPSFQRLLDDIVEFLIIHRSSSNGPTFVVGISWGGKLAAALPFYRPNLIDGLVLICPGFFPKLTSRMRRLSKFIPLVKLLFPRHRISVPLSDPTLFTSTPRWLEFLRHDRLALHKATARFLAASLDLDRYLHQVSQNFHLPVLLILAGQDRIIENAPTREFVEHFATADREIIVYPQAHHTLEFEPQPDQFTADLIAWLMKHSETRP
ncbi:MAG: alpha/beta fold hydrolase [Gemmataceae bacterium]